MPSRQATQERLTEECSTVQAEGKLLATLAVLWLVATTNEEKKDGKKRILLSLSLLLNLRSNKRLFFSYFSCGTVGEASFSKPNYTKQLERNEEICLIKDDTIK